MWEALATLQQADVNATEPLVPCALCGSCDSNDDSRLAMCPLCLLTMHGSCAASIVDADEFDVEAEAAHVQITNIPREFSRSCTCSLCNTVIASLVDDAEG